MKCWLSAVSVCINCRQAESQFLLLWHHFKLCEFDMKDWDDASWQNDASNVFFCKENMFFCGRISEFAVSRDLCVYSVDSQHYSQKGLGGVGVGESSSQLFYQEMELLGLSSKLHIINEREGISKYLSGVVWLLCCVKIMEGTNKGVFF